MRGTITKSLSGFYTVKLEDNSVHVCKARGKFRKDGIKPMVGDVVDIVPSNDSELGNIETVRERDNQWKRPQVANIDVLIMVMSASWPKPDFLLYDKLMINAVDKGVDVIICINKCDDAEQEIISSIERDYDKCSYPICSVSAHTKQGIDELKEMINGKICGLAGQSGVGKTSIINALMPDLDLQTGGRSAKTERGKHTTRHVELLELPEGGCIVDTPGFSLLEIDEIEEDQLKKYYHEFMEYEQDCSFNGCVHVNEPKCAVKAAVENGLLSSDRYERYIEIYKILQENRRKRYD